MKYQNKNTYVSPEADVVYFALDTVLTTSNGAGGGIELPDDEFPTRKLAETVSSWLDKEEE